MIESADSDLPQPDSPTSATVSPGATGSDEAVDSRQLAAPGEADGVERSPRTSRGTAAMLSDPAASD